MTPTFIKSKLTPPPPAKCPPSRPLPVDDAAARPQVLRPEQAAVQREVLQEAGLALWRRVDVSVVADGEQRLQAVLHHAGHRHGNQPVRLVVLEDVAPLAVQQQHDGLKERGSRSIVSGRRKLKPGRAQRTSKSGFSVLN